MNNVLGQKLNKTSVKLLPSLLERAKNGNYKAMVACLGTMHPITEDKKTDIPYKQICAIAFQTVSELYSYTHGKSISKKSISEFIRELKFDIVTYNTMENS